MCDIAPYFLPILITHSKPVKLTDRCTTYNRSTIYCTTITVFISSYNSTLISSIRILRHRLHYTEFKASRLTNIKGKAVTSKGIFGRKRKRNTCSGCVVVLFLCALVLLLCLQLRTSLIKISVLTFSTYDKFVKSSNATHD